MHLNIHYLIQQYGYQGVFFALLLEMIGVPFPGETILTFLGIEWKQGAFSLFPLIMVALAGNIIGSTISYLIGRFLGRSIILHFGKFLRITEQRFNNAEKRFNKYRISVILFGKFVAGIRVLAAYLAGINKMDFWKFTFYNAIGSLLWVLSFIISGRYIDIVWHNYHHIFHQFIWLFGSALLIAFIIVIFIRSPRESKKVLKN
ncbi:MAG: DedA family protein [Bacillota bacterium]|nr:DedA family protein [Bacillota bacterium]